MNTTPPFVLYGITNCSTVKKARAFLDARGVAYHFHDFKKAGAPTDLLTRWMQAAGWDKVLNRQGMTWRKTSPTTQAAITDAASAAAFLTAQPSAIKRPVVEWPGGRITLGFAPDEWERLLAG